MEIYQNCAGANGKYIMQELKLPAIHATPKAVADYEALGKRRIHWMDDQNMPGCCQINTSWYFAANREQQLHPTEETNVYTKWQCHVHDVDEILCFYGSDPEDPYNLHGEIELILGDESHILTKSSLIYVPAGMRHSTPLVNRIDRPIFHFSMVLNPNYNFVAEDGGTFMAK